MKKHFVTAILAIFMTSQASAQTEWTVNTRAWSTNYFTALIYYLRHSVPHRHEQEGL